MRIVIAGSGRVGGALASRLVGEKHAVTVIDQNRAVCERIFEEIGAATVCGDATDPQVLEAAGIGAVDIAAGLLTRDADNLAFAMLVRSLSSARVMVRMFDTSFEPAYRLAGVRDLIAEAEVVVAKMSIAIEYPQMLGSLPLARDAVLFEVKIGARAAVTGKTVAEVRAIAGFPADCVFIGLVDERGSIELPKGSSVVTAGQIAVMVARKEQIARAIECLTTQPAEGKTGLLPSLRDIDFFSPLSDEELADLSRGIQLLRKKAHSAIYRRGDAGELFYLVLSGEVSLIDEQAVPEIRRAGDFFGEVPMLTGEPETADAIASTDVELATIGKDDFRRVVMANPGVALEMSRILGRRLASASRRESPKKRGLFGR